MANIDNNYTKNDLSLKEIVLRMLNGIKKYGWCILVLACIGAIFNIGRVYISYTPAYAATATFTVSTDVSNDNSYYNNTAANQLSKTFPYILTSGVLNRIVAKDLGMETMPGTITSSVLEGTNLFTITVTSNDYETAYNVLKSVINNYPEVAKYIIGNTQLTLISPPTASSKPVNEPSYKITALIGAAAGAVVALAIIALIVLLSSTLRTPEEIRTLLNCKKLGVIVKVYQKKSHAKKNPYISITDKNIDNRFIEAINSIRNSILRTCKKKNIKTIMVTSTSAGEGKTTISANLATTLAKKHYKTIIVDCDLRNPSVKKHLGICNDVKSIEDVLKGKATLSDAIVHVKKTDLYALLGTKYSPDASELISGTEIKKLIAVLRKTFDYVILDVPPAGIISDAVALKDDIDGLIFVIKEDYAKVKRIQDAIDSFGNSKIEIIGCIFNQATGAFGNKGYGRYGYGGYLYGNSAYGYGNFYGEQDNDNDSDD